VPNAYRPTLWRYLRARSYRSLKVRRPGARVYLFVCSRDSTGCMIVELLDYRPPKGREASLDVPETSRVVLRPTSETVTADIARIARNADMWSDVEALELEAKILVRADYPHLLHELT
jgi:hypothetical protein